jgi:micrococcal nuclease
MRALLIVAGICFSAPALAMTPAACAGGVEIAHAKIIRVEKKRALILGDGRAVMLEGIRLPLADGGPPALAEHALRALRELTMAAPLTLTAVPPKEDRYDRVRVQAFGQVWLQTELLSRGLARAATASDRPECAVEFYAAEKAARAAGRGLWAFPAFAARKSDSVPAADEGSFQIVEGKVVNSAVHDDRVFLDFSPDYRRATRHIAPEDRKAFRNTNPLAENLAGHTIRLRGMVQDYGGRPEIALSNPAEIEFLN